MVRFGDRVADPQNEGMGEGAFSREGFHRGWAAGNRVARSALEASAGTSSLVWPTDQLEGIWRWNYGRRDFQERIGSDLFVPKISFFRASGRLVTASVWTDGIPVVTDSLEGVADWECFRQLNSRTSWGYFVRCSNRNSDLLAVGTAQLRIAAHCLSAE